MPETDPIDMQKMMMKIKKENEKTVKEIAAEERRIKGLDKRSSFSMHRNS